MSTIDPRHSGHQMIGHKKIYVQFALQKHKCFFSRRGLDHVIAAVAEHIGGAHADEILIFDEKTLPIASGSAAVVKVGSTLLDRSALIGSHSSTFVPKPSSLLSASAPPAADGSGKSSGPVEEVVELIRQKGGTAVPNFDTVAEPSAAASIVKTALDHFGRLDGVVNNAGILRDAIFHKMSVADFELVIKVHLFGSFYVSHAAARLFREQGSGVFVHFTSTSGLVGNLGQANYAAARLGIVGLSKSIALDMARFNVRSNCVSPFAWSRLIDTIPTNTEEEKARVARIQAMGPEKIAPLCVFLLSDQAKDVTGQIFAVRMNEIFLMSQSSHPFGAPVRGLDLPLDH